MEKVTVFVAFHEVGDNFVPHLNIVDEFVKSVTCRAPLLNQIRRDATCLSGELVLFKALEGSQK